ncbi:hypothetical protein N656DRAFT_386143 [Canariomyces notabilis]|uniref:Uncharacterized protein n=1 Tax=Canariomyces notabilis TaxID=2074819 RepID=A0AAN6TJD5_9PEZI|nr:hypothetical protein N656DRAFT_386143 [Canariomyces arenarius]
MSSTTTTPPSTRVQIHQAAVLALRARALLTIASRPELSSLIRAAEAREDDALPPERPAKRLRLGPGAEASSLTRCLESQVFPYVDSAIAALPKDRVNTLEIGKRVSAAPVQPGGPCLTPIASLRLPYLFQFFSQRCASARS